MEIASKFWGHQNQGSKATAQLARALISPLRDQNVTVSRISDF